MRIVKDEKPCMSGKTGYTSLIQFFDVINDYEMVKLEGPSVNGVDELVSAVGIMGAEVWVDELESVFSLLAETWKLESVFCLGGTWDSICCGGELMTSPDLGPAANSSNPKHKL